MSEANTATLRTKGLKDTEPMLIDRIDADIGAIWCSTTQGTIYVHATSKPSNQGNQVRRTMVTQCTRVSIPHKDQRGEVSLFFRFHKTFYQNLPRYNFQGSVEQHGKGAVRPASWQRLATGELTSLLHLRWLWYVSCKAYFLHIAAHVDVRGYSTDQLRNLSIWRAQWHTCMEKKAQKHPAYKLQGDKIKCTEAVKSTE